ncbi:serine protease inhibitor 3/4-like [Galleria mellonella]|uniref:Serine protease inhibitor 3/4-like n=1 Tax=Galleria mellonella TaxID=7137 RepID=A0A6J1WSQ0_GALME|nr:serine protease inhibitor 3/4-like [Galleria mellonella]
MRSLLIIFAYATLVFSFDNKCSYRRTAAILKRSTYDFSVRLLDRVSQETNEHFVYSPLSTWLQLASLAEGATNYTLNEIWSITRHHRRYCLKEIWKQIINKMDADLETVYKRKSVLVIDKLLNVKKSFIKNVEKLKSLKVLLYNFNNEIGAADGVNNYIEEATDGEITDVVYPDDFDSTLALMVGAVYYSNAWKMAFNPVYTQLQPFHTREYSDNVNMMKQIGYYNITEIPVINSTVLEIPCQDDRVSMLFFLPKSQSAVDLFYSLRKIHLITIKRLFKNNGPKLVNVELPRFNITTDIDSIPELIHDMGAKRLFHPKRAEFNGISDYPVYTSLMAQVVYIEVTEHGVKGEALAENMVLDDKPIDFIVNKPFAFMLVDKVTDLILFAGAYSVPSVF